MTAPLARPVIPAGDARQETATEAKPAFVSVSIPSTFSIDALDPPKYARSREGERSSFDGWR